MLYKLKKDYYSNFLNYLMYRLEELPGLHLTVLVALITCDIYECWCAAEQHAALLTVLGPTREAADTPTASFSM